MEGCFDARNLRESRIKDVLKTRDESLEKRKGRSLIDSRQSFGEVSNLGALSMSNAAFTPPVSI